MLNLDPKETVEYINKLKASGIDNIRVEFTRSNDNLNIIKEYYRNNQSITIKDELREAQLAAKDKIMADRISEYSYVLDKNLSEYEILVRYINQNMGHTYITVEELKDILKPI